MDELPIDLNKEAEAIKRLYKQGLSACMEIGEILLKVKGTIEFQRYCDWIQAEFKWVERNARVYITIYTTLAAHKELVRQSMLPLRTLRVLCSSYISDEKRVEVLTRTVSGEKFTFEDIRALSVKPGKPVNPLKPIEVMDQIGPPEPLNSFHPINDVAPQVIEKPVDPPIIVTPLKAKPTKYKTIKLPPDDRLQSQVNGLRRIIEIREQTIADKTAALDVLTETYHQLQIRYSQLEAQLAQAELEIQQLKTKEVER